MENFRNHNSTSSKTIIEDKTFNEDKFILKYNEIYTKSYISQSRTLWLAEAYTFETDSPEFDILKENYTILYKSIVSIIMYFLPLDDSIADNIIVNFMANSKTREEQEFYVVQALQEVEHSKIYRKIFDQFFDYLERKQLSIKFSETIYQKEIENFIKKWSNPSISVTKRRYAFSNMEGILIQDKFTLISIIRNKLNLLKNFVEIQRLISEDEYKHYICPCKINSLVKNYFEDLSHFNKNSNEKIKKISFLEDEEYLSEEEAFEITRDCVRIAKLFSSLYMNEDELFLGYTMDDIYKNIEFIANGLTTNSGYGYIFPDSLENPISISDEQFLDDKTNPYEKRDTNYRRLPNAKRNLFYN